MTCGGCSGAVTRALKKAETDGMSSVMAVFAFRSHLWPGLGIDTYDVSLEKQEVVVKGTIPYDTLLERIKKTGKEVGSPVPRCCRR